MHADKQDVLKRMNYIEGHLHTCVPEGIASGRGEEIIDELVQLYNLAGNR